MKLVLNMKFNLAMLLCVIILAVLWTGRKIKENYVSYVDGRQDIPYEGESSEDRASAAKGKAAANEVGEKLNDAVDTVSDNTSSVLQTIYDFIDTTPKVSLPQWRDSYGDGVTMPDTITTGVKPDTSLILTDGCSTKSILKSDYVNDICVVNAGDYPTIDAKCKALEKDNCNLPSCCILINGTKCVAGDANGPTYLTDQGNQIDYYYYLYQNKCYGPGCNDASNNNTNKCGKYAKNSTNISKDCMIQMFNDAGCKNLDPMFVVNDSYLYNNSKSSKKYIQNDLNATAKKLLKGISQNDPDSRVKCLADPNNPCDQYLSTDKKISRACMIRMYNDAGCENKKPPLITNGFVSDHHEVSKKDINNQIALQVGWLKEIADAAEVGSNEYKVCYGNKQRPAAAGTSGAGTSGAGTR